MNDNVALAAVKQINSNSQYSTHFQERFNVDGTPESTDLESIFNNPQDHIDDIVSYSKYCYRKHGIIMRVINIIRDFGATNFELSYPKRSKKAKNVIDKYNEQIDVEQLVHDMMFELALTGNLACYDRDGIRVDIYPIDMIQVVPLISNNKQVIAYKVNSGDITTDDYGDAINKAIEKAYPKEILDAMNDGSSEYAILDIDKSYFAKINSSQYEPYGVSIIMPAFEDLAHKTLLKEAEKATANDIINKILHIQVGDADNKPSDKMLQQYSALFAGQSGSLVATTPYYVTIGWIEPETDIFGEDKFVEIDKDILNTLGVSLTLIRGEGGGNYAEGMLNFTGLVRTIEGIRHHIPCILQGLYRAELERNGMSPDYAPTVHFDDVVIDKSAKTELLMTLFQNAGLPYRALYEGCDMDYDYIKLMREDENDEQLEQTFSLHSMPFQGGYSNDPNANSGRPESNLEDRKTDPTSSNNNAPRTGLTNTSRSNTNATE